MTDQKLKRGNASQSSLSSSSDNIPQLDNNSALLEPILDDIIEDSLHTLGLISSAQAVAETDKDHQFRNKNLKPIDVPLVTQSQSPDTMDGDGSSHLPSTPLNLTGMEVVRTNSGFHLDFDWLNCEGQPLNKKNDVCIGVKR